MTKGYSGRIDQAGHESFSTTFTVDPNHSSGPAGCNIEPVKAVHGQIAVITVSKIEAFGLGDLDACHFSSIKRTFDHTA